MRVLLDHCVDSRFIRHLPNHEAKTAHEMGWQELKNGELLVQASADFDVVITVDRNLKYQQNLKNVPIAVVVLIGKSSRLADLISLIPQLEVALQTLKPRTFIEVVA